MVQNDPNPKKLPSSTFPSIPSLWDELGEKMGQWMGSNKGVTVSEDKNKVYIEADLPGLSSKDLDISLHQHTLIIKGHKKEETEDKERRFYRRAQRSFYYEVELPSSVEENTEQAFYEDGVLKITFNKTAEGHMRKISIKGDSV